VSTLPVVSDIAGRASYDVAHRRIADVDRRFYAFAIDLLIAWSIDLAVTAVVSRTLPANHHVPLGVPVIAATVPVVGPMVGLVFALLQGVTGRTPGKSVTGLRLVDTAAERPIGARRAVVRALVLGLAAIPFGFGLAALAWTAVADRSGLCRGWHDRLVSSIVVDVRPEPAVASEPDDGPGHVVNLTALRLAPAHRAPAAAEPAPVPALTPRPAAPRPWGPTSATTATWTVSFDSGERVAIDTLLLVGRSPDPRLVEQGARLVSLPSADMSVSRTHVEVVVAPDGALVVTDRGSTNGSTLVRQGTARHLTPGRPATLLEGDVVLLGDRTMQVERGRSDSA
jgi:uncharacterized RDD family membrane protein YckC